MFLSVLSVLQYERAGTLSFSGPQASPGPGTQAAWAGGFSRHLSMMPASWAPRTGSSPCPACGLCPQNSVTCVLTAWLFALCPSQLDGTSMWSLVGPCSDEREPLGHLPSLVVPDQLHGFLGPSLRLCFVWDIGLGSHLLISQSSNFAGSCLAALSPTSLKGLHPGMLPSAQVCCHGGA